MKKYRLYYPEMQQNPRALPFIFNSKERAQEEVLCRVEHGAHTIFDYRIEEFEESITDRVKSYEDAWKIKHGDRDGLDIRDNYIVCLSLIADKELVRHLTVLINLETITAALNEGWKPDWESEKQEKWHVVSSPTDGYIASAESHFSAVPSRLYFKSRELAEYAAKQFSELYKQLLIEAF